MANFYVKQRKRKVNRAVHIFERWRMGRINLTYRSCIIFQKILGILYNLKDGPIHMLIQYIKNNNEIYYVVRET